MRRSVLHLATAAACFAASLHPPAAAAGRKAPPHAPAAHVAKTSDPGQPPHAWLFGTWTGGLFPAPSGVTAETCQSQPVVIFTRDIVLRASLTDQFYTQRLIETALTSGGGTQFRFTAAAAPAGVLASASGAGFGCSDPDTLTVLRKGDNEITFPGCGDFPNPLVRCPSR